MSHRAEVRAARLIVEHLGGEIVEWEPRRSNFVTVDEAAMVDSAPVPEPSVTWEQPDLFDDVEMQKLRSWKSPDTLRDMGAAAARRTRRQQGKPANVEVEL